MTVNENDITLKDGDGPGALACETIRIQLYFDEKAIPAGLEDALEEAAREADVATHVSDARVAPGRYTVQHDCPERYRRLVGISGGWNAHETVEHREGCKRESPSPAV